jgi:hypothetical protein
VVCSRLQYIIEFSPKPSRTLPSALEAKLVNEQWLQKWTEKWLNWEITSFRYLCIMNWASGRVFLGDVNYYPIFPNFAVNLRVCRGFSTPPIDARLQGVIPHSKSLISLPEIYFFPHVCKSFEMMYNNRRILEEFQNLNVWITYIFGSSRREFAHRRLFKEPHPRKPDFVSGIGQARIGVLPVDSSISHFLRMKRNAAGFVLASGIVTFCRLSGEGDKVMWEQIGQRRMENSGQLFGLPDGLAIDDGSLTILTVNAVVRSEPLWLSSFAISGDVCQTSDSVLARFEWDNAGIKILEMAELRERIACFTSSAKFGRTAACCDDGKLRIQSNLTGKKVATVALDEEVPVMVLITRSWGLIVVKTIDSIFVFDVNRCPVAKMANPMDVRVWATYRSRQGFDFVVCQDTQEKVRCFEAAFPDRMIGCTVDTGGDLIVGIIHDWREECLTFVMQN